MPLTLFSCCATAASELNVVTIGGDAFDDVHPCCTTQGDERQVIDISSEILDENPKYLVVDDALDPFLNVTISSRCDGDRKSLFLSPCQKHLKDRLRLPSMGNYPVPLHCSPDDPEVRISELFKTFERFVLELHKGVSMTQVNAHSEYANVHCQLVDDLQTFKVDPGNGSIVEFPLTAVTRMYRDVKPARQVAGGMPVPLPMVCVERHFVVLEFMKRSLVLVFGTAVDAQSFMMCMDLLVRFAQEARAKKTATGDRKRVSLEPTDSSDDEDTMTQSI
jgi:hypothetical protein